MNTTDGPVLGQDDLADLFGVVAPPRPRCTLDLDALASLPQWVPWTFETKGGKETKVPRNPYTGRYGSASDPLEWAERDRADDRARILEVAGQRSGVGLVLGELQDESGRHLGGLDLDGCHDPKTCKIEPWAREIMARFDSYAEISPSGKGIKVIYSYDPADLEWFLKTNPGRVAGRNFSRGNHVEVSIWFQRKFFTVTEEWLVQSSLDIRRVGREDMDWLIQEVGPKFKGKKPGKPGEAARGEGDGIDRSGELMKIPRRVKGNSGTFEQFEEAARADAHAAGHLRDQADPERALDRAWENCVPDQVASLNRLHAVLPIGGHERVLTLRGRQDYSIGNAEDLRLRYRPDWVTVDNKLRPLADVWLGSRDRRAYPEGLTFLPGGEVPAGMFNTWRGWAVDPDPEAQPELRCPRILEHLRFLFGEHSEWGLDWIADKFQRPWEKPGTTVIARGDEGAGKDIPAEYLGRILGLHCTVVADPKHLTGNFNAHLSRAVLVHATDSVWGGDKAAGGKLRAMVTQKKLPLEHKGQDVVTVDTFARYWISTNAEWAIEAARNSRRWFIVEVPNTYVGDRAYWKALAAEMDGGGPAALLAFLLARKITSDLRQAPETAALRQQRLESLRGPQAWIVACVEAGEILSANPAWVNAGEWPDGVVSPKLLREACEAWLRGGRHRGDMTRPEVFGRTIKPFTEAKRPKLPRDGKPTQQLGYQLLPVDDCRRVMTKLYGAGED